MRKCGAMIPKTKRAAAPKAEITHAKQELYAGPLPHPSTMKGFQEIDPSFPERIMAMTEKITDAEIKAMESNTRANFILPAIGQAATLLIALSGIGAAVFFVMKGVSSAAIVSILGGLSPIIIAALENLRK